MFACPFHSMQYYAICKPLKANYKCTIQRAVVTIFCLWSIALVATTPVLLGTELVQTLYIDGTLVSVCITKANSAWQKTYFFASMAAFFWIPFLILILVYCIIIKRLMLDSSHILAEATPSPNSSTIKSETKTSHKLITSNSLANIEQHTANGSLNNKEFSLWPTVLWKSRRHSTANHSTESEWNATPNGRRVSSALSSRCNANGEKAQIRSRRQVVFMLVAVVVCFFICLLPFRLFTLWMLVASEDEIRDLSMERFYNLLYFCRIMLYVNSMVNPFLYAVVSTKFRNALVECVCQYCCYCSDYLWCFTCTDQDDLDFAKGMGPRGKMRRRYRRNRRFLMRQSTFNTTTTTNTSSSIKNQSLKSFHMDNQSKYPSMDSIGGTGKPKILLQQNSLDNSTSKTDSLLCHPLQQNFSQNDHEAIEEYAPTMQAITCLTMADERLYEPYLNASSVIEQYDHSPRGNNVLQQHLDTQTQNAVEQRRLTTFKRTTRVCIVDTSNSTIHEDDGHSSTSSTTNNSPPSHADKLENGSVGTNPSLDHDANDLPDVASVDLPSIEEILSDPQFSTYESYV